MHRGSANINYRHFKKYGSKIVLVLCFILFVTGFLRLFKREFLLHTHLEALLQVWEQGTQVSVLAFHCEADVLVFH